MYDSNFDPYEDVDNMGRRASTLPPPLPPPRYGNPPPPYSDEAFQRLKRPAPPTPTDRQGSEDSSDRPWSTTPTTSNPPPPLTRMGAVDAWHSYQQSTFSSPPACNVRNGDGISRSDTFGSNTSERSAVDDDEISSKKPAKKTPFGVNILQRPFAKRKPRREREKVSNSDSDGSEDQTEKKSNKMFEYRQSISDVTQSISEVTHRVGGTLSRWIGRLSTANHNQPHEYTMNPEGPSDDTEDYMQPHHISPPITWAPPLPPTQIATQQIGTQIAAGDDVNDDDSFDSFTDDEEEYANREEIEATREIETIYQNDKEIETPATSSQMDIDLMWMDTAAPSSSTTTTRLVSRTMSSPEDTRSIYDNSPPISRHRRDDEFVGTTWTGACDETGLPASSEWTGDAMPEKHSTKDANRSPTGSTSKSSKLEAIKRDLKLMFPISAGKPKGEAKTNALKLNIEESSSAPSSPTFPRWRPHAKAQPCSPLAPTAPTVKPALSEAFKGVMPSPMATRRLWQPVNVTGEGQEANSGPNNAAPSARLHTWQTPSPQNSQSSPLLPNRALPLIPVDYRSPKTTTESTFKVTGEGHEANSGRVDVAPPVQRRALQTSSSMNLQSSPLLPNRALPLIPVEARSSQMTTELPSVPPPLPQKQQKSPPHVRPAAATGYADGTSVRSSNRDHNGDLSTMTVDLHQYAWYFGTMNRELSDIKLKTSSQEGGFIVRESSRGGSNCPYAISLYHAGVVFNLLIRKKSNEKFALGVEKLNEKEFDHVAELVAYHRRYPVCVTLPDSQSLDTVLLVSSPAKLL